MINRSLRTFDVDIIAMMGFFLKDIDSEIKKLYKSRTALTKPFTVYRGQGLSPNDFDQLKSSEGGLLSFNNFLSTSKTRQVATEFLKELWR